MDVTSLTSCSQNAEAFRCWSKKQAPQQRAVTTSSADDEKIERKIDALNKLMKKNRDDISRTDPATQLIQAVETLLGERFLVDSVQSEFAPVPPTTNSGTSTVNVPQPPEAIKVGDSWEVEILYNGQPKRTHVLVLGFYFPGRGRGTKDALVAYYWSSREMDSNAVQHSRMAELGKQTQYSMVRVDGHLIPYTKIFQASCSDIIGPLASVEKVHVVVLAPQVNRLGLPSFLKKVDVVQEETMELTPRHGLKESSSVTQVIWVPAIFHILT
jgi:hypothetical protein